MEFAGKQETEKKIQLGFRMNVYSEEVFTLFLSIIRRWIK